MDNKKKKSSKQGQDHKNNIPGTIYF